MTRTIIPEAALSQHIAVLGKTGSGKSYAAKAVIVEPLLKARRRVGIVDPTSAWWGLRSSADGRSAGFPVLVLGGDHGDLPLPALGGAAVARLLAEQNVNLIADTSQLSVGERTRWFIDFATTLYRTNRAPLHLVLDEAHNFAPQGKVPDPDTGKMLHAANTLASGGRSRGIRLVMITQRPQKLHKDALTSADTLIAMRVLAPHDREAVKAWVDGCGDPAQGKQVLDSLAGLQRGEGWVWYPEGGHLARVRFPAIKTFDSSATPTDGKEVRQPKGAADIDLAEIRAALADAVKEAEASDPKLLRAALAKRDARIKELERAPAAKPGTPQLDRAALQEAEQRGYERGREEGARDGYTAGLRAVQATTDRLGTLSGAVRETIDDFLTDLKRLTAMVPKPIPGRAGPAPRTARASPAPAPARAAPRRLNGSGTAIPKGERAILIACAQTPGGATREQLTQLTGYKRSTRDAYIQRLREKGYVDDDGSIVATPDGIAALGGDYEPLPTGDALLQHWLGRLPDGERICLQALSSRGPVWVERSALDAETPYKRSTRDAYLGRLTARKLIEAGARGQVRASEGLFG